MVRIAFIHNRFPAGGAERITIDVASYLSRFEGYQVYVYASRVSDHLMTDEARSSLILRRIPKQAIPSHRAKAIENLIKEDKIEILVQVTKAIPGIDKIVEHTGVKTVVSCHGEPFWQRYAIVYRRQKGLVRKLMWKLCNEKKFADGSLAMNMAITRTRREYESCDAYTVLCRAYKSEVEKVFGIKPSESHIYAIENPEYPVASVNYEKEKMVLFCGRFENWSKRIDRLLRIWAKVQHRMPEWKLVLVGDGESWDMLTEMARELSLERIFFEGRRNNVADYYRRASVVALTSQTEGWGLALTEAQAHGCIPIAFGCTSGIKEVLLAEQGCGIEITPFDEEEFASQLINISQMGEQEQMAIRKNAVERIKRYTPEIISEKWKVLFDELSIE